MTPDLECLFSFLRFASVSTDPGQAGEVQACAHWLVELLQGQGLLAETVATSGHPLVLARNGHRAGRRSVLIYGHYDVQPVDPLELWETSPFEPVLKGGKIFARGATDNKGQMMAHVLGVGKLLAAEPDLPLNLTLLFEGEEEVGSQSLHQYLKEKKEELACDVVVVSDTGMIAPGVPTMGYGLRGITALEGRVRGPARDVHSGVYGGAIANPATVAARLLASLHDKEGRVAVDGFYDEVQPLHDWERALWDQLPDGDQEVREATGVSELFGESGFSSYERLWARPTLEVNGLGGGYQGPGSKTIVPAEAFFKLSARLVPNQSPDEIFGKIQKHLEANCPGGVDLHLEQGHGGQPYLGDPQSEYGKAAQEALGRVFGKEPMLIREGGSIPIIQAFQEELGADSLMLGLALPDAQIHSPNESFHLENFEKGMQLSQEVLRGLAALP